MCGIFGSSYKRSLKDLALANSSRGSATWSITLISFEAGKTTILTTYQGLGSFPKELPFETADYYLCHIQAPTTSEASLETAHPAVFNSRLLWHNGIINAETLKGFMLKTSSTWDTKALLEEIALSKGVGNTLESVLSGLKGSFACCYYDESGLVVFHNELAPLYFDKNLTLSSVPFKKSKEVETFKTFDFDFDNKRFVERGVFKKAESTYWGV